MIIFKIENLKEFQKRTQFIKSNDAFPALAYIKLECRESKYYLTKNNLKCVCEYMIAAEGECPDLLLDDKKFSAFISKAKSDLVKVKWDDEKIYLSDGKQLGEMPRQSVENFPKTPDYSQAKSSFTLKKEHLEVIAIAKQYVTNTDTAGNFKFIHIGGEFISAFHTMYFYVCNKFTDLPNMIIDSEIADVITAGEQFEVGISDNKYFFLAGNVVYIFTQQEGKTPNIKNSVWNKLLKTGKDFQFAKENIVDFCELANVFSNSELVYGSLYKQGDYLMMSMKDNNWKTGNNKVSPVVGDLDKISFDCRMVAAPFKFIPYETLKCKTVENCLIISGEKEFFCIMGLAV